MPTILSMPIDFSLQAASEFSSPFIDICCKEILPEKKIDRFETNKHKQKREIKILSMTGFDLE